jgi:hypothetical protein
MSGDIRGLEEPVSIPSSGQPKGPKSVETRDLHGPGSCGQNAVNLSKGAAPAKPGTSVKLVSLERVSAGFGSATAATRFR